MKSFKKLFALSAAVMMLVSLLFTGCTQSSSTQQKSEPAKAESSSPAPKKEEVKYPTKPIQVIVPVAPGGDTDVNARVFSKYMEKELGQPVVIVNVNGSSGTVGMKKVMDSAKDGYTVLFFHTEGLIPKITGLVDYSVEDFDMAGIGILDNTTVLAVNKNAPYKTLKDLVAAAKKDPGKIEFGMSIGGYPHLVGLALEKVAGIDLNLVDIGGNAAKTAALKGQKTDVINTQYGLTKSYFDSGDFVSLGLLSSERNPLMPDMPTTKEQGFDMDFNKFFFYAMPKGTPKEITDKFSAAMKKVVDNPEYQAEAKKAFLTPTYMDPQKASEYAQKVNKELVKYQDLLRAGSKK